MKKPKFTHLHVHSEYSLLDATSKIKELISKTKELGMDSIAITDHGVMYGVIDFYKEAKKQGIKPIIGCEIYVASMDRKNKEHSKDNYYYHLVLLAENNIGYQNLIKLVSIGFVEGYYYKPRVDIETLKKYSEGIIALSACLSGVVTKDLLNISYDKGLEKALLYNDIFGEGNFFLEIQDHGISDEIKVNPDILKIHKETKIPIVCTNDVHYIYKEDYKPHDVFLCIQTGKTIDDEDRMTYGTDQLYLKSPEEMQELFPHIPEALENTYKISERCNVTIDFNEYKLPKFKLDDGVDSYEYLRKLCEEGIEKRYEVITDEIKNRLEMELETIKQMDFIDYFLITWDFIKFAKDNDILVGPGRGSAAGSIVSYTLDITAIDPIKYNLIFERFLNPERISMPDIDIDFCYERRQEVIDYVINKYGKDHVAQIITFGTLQARAAIRDTGRALGIQYAIADEIAKMIPNEIGITIKKALIQNHELKLRYDTDEQIENLIDMSLRLEGLPRHASTHAAGVVICDEPITEYVPLYQNDGVITTQFTMTILEELGLLKMDFLGLRTLTVIDNSIKEIKRNYGIKIDFSKMDYDDKEMFNLIGSGKTDGIFQLESAGMKSFMRTLSPKSLEDVIAGISLYRPGPMEFIPKYIYGKNNQNNIQYTHDALIPILKSTYGCIVYQEQVMEIVRELAGYSFGRSDLVRRAMSKKDIKVMNEERENFIYGIEEDNVPGCIKNGINKAAAEIIFDEMIDFAKYAFNKSHAAAYAVIGYQTAYLKYYYPVEFMAALISSIMGASKTKVAEYIIECRDMGIDLLPPDINRSFEYFSVKDKSIRFGLAGIKNVGRPVIKNIIKEREEDGDFKSLTEFVNRMDGKDISKRCLESLIKSGAFDSFGGKRKQYCQIYIPLLDGVSQTRKKNIEGQMDLFSMITTNKSELYKDTFINDDEFPKKELLEYEKEVIGIYISGHPLEEYVDVLNKYSNKNSLDFISDDDDGKIDDNINVTIGGIITGRTIKYTKNNKAMAFLTIEDLYGSIEIIVFPNVYDKYFGRLNEDSIILVSGKTTSREDEDSKIICNNIKFWNEIESNDTKNTLWLKIPNNSDFKYIDLIKILSLYKGNVPVVIYNEKEKKKLPLGYEYNVSTNDSMLDSFRGMLGDDCVVLVENK